MNEYIIKQSDIDYFKQEGIDTLNQIIDEINYMRLHSGDNEQIPRIEKNETI